MRLNPSWQREVTVYPPEKRKDGMGAVSTVPGVPSPAAFHVQPGGDTRLLQEYGLRAARMITCYAEPGTPVQMGDYVRVHAEDKPDYRVVQVQRWPNHCRIDLEEAEVYAGN